MLTKIPNDTSSTPAIPAYPTSAPRVVLVASEYNGQFVDGLVHGAQSVFEKAGLMSPSLYRVPGAYEIPVLVRHLVAPARNEAASNVVPLPDAVICLGVIWQGQTGHADLIASSITQALMDLQVASGIPCVHEILLVRDEEQARQRCLNMETNRGVEAAATALKMIHLLKSLRQSQHSD